MYHSRSPFSSGLMRTGRTAAAVLLGSAGMLATAAPSQAAVNQSPQTRQEINQTRLSVLDGSEVTRIDWRQPKMQLKFDLAEGDWIDGIDLILSMSPQGNVSERGPILVSLNNSAPLKMNPYGQGFDARLRFDQSFVRAKGNVITIRVPAPDGAPCLTSAHGHWDVNTKKSSIVVRTRAKSRNLYLREVAHRLQNPTTSPKTVSVLASGAEKLRLEMLAAQGIALQTPTIPNFKTTAGRSDMEVIIARRDQLAPRVSDKDILSESGPRISVHKGRPMRLVITGDTDAEVLNAVKAFASHQLPAVRRNETSSGEVSLQTSFADEHVVLNGKTRFDDLNQAISTMDWRGTPNTLAFKVSDPSVKSGNIRLRLSSGSKISEDSKVEVQLNGQSLGFTTLDRPRKSVDFTIPEGALHGGDNILKVMPQLNRNPSVETFGQSCPSMDDTPGFFIGNGSRIELTANGATPLSELSRLTSDGSLFAVEGGANTHIMLTSRSQNDIGASLEVLAKLAKTSGTGWINATVSSEALLSDTKNLFIIGPKAANSGLLDRAPRGLSAALNGQNSTGEMVRNFGDYEKFASANTAKTLQIYAAKAQTKSRIGSGGVAAVFPDQQRLIGVISNTPGRKFSSVTQDLLKDEQWNKLSGSVARWNSKSVLMAQTAIPTPGMSIPQTTPPTLPRFDVAWLEDGVQDAYEKLRELGDVAESKFEVIKRNVETRFAETLPVQTSPFETPIKAQAAPTPVFISQKSRELSRSAPSTSPSTSPVYKTAAAAAPQSLLTGSPALIAPLRGFIYPSDLVKNESRAPKWLTDIMLRFQKTEAQSNTFSATADNLSALSPVKKMTQFTSGSYGFFGIMMSLAILILIMLLGSIRPKTKGPRKYKSLK